jgi:hypothetical protein
MTLTPDTLIILWRITRSTRSFPSLKRVNLEQEKLSPDFIFIWQEARKE